VHGSGLAERYGAATGRTPARKRSGTGRGSRGVARAGGDQALNTTRHKGYTVRVEYDKRDNIFVGPILGIRSIISFRGTTVKALRSEFVRAIDNYLSGCAEKGSEPEKHASGKLLPRAPPEVHGKALAAAQAAGKSLNQWAAEVLARALHARSSAVCRHHL